MKIKTSFILAALFAAFVSVGFSQSDIDTKIRLMTEALQARDSGDLDKAQQRLQELLEISPEDQSVRSVMRGVEQMVADKKAGITAPAALSNDRMAALQSEAEYIARLETERIEKTMQAAREIREIAVRQAKRGDFTLALSSLKRAINSLEPNPLTQTLIDDLKREERDVLRQKSMYEAKKAAVSGGGSGGNLALEQISPDFVSLQREVEALELRGRSQFFAGDIDGAEATFKQIEALDPNNAMAKSFLVRISRERQSMAYLNKLKTREQLLEEVSNAWQRPGIYEERPDINPTVMGPAPLMQKLNNIIIPNVNFTEVNLNRVVNTLSAISEEFDNTNSGARGVNLVLLDTERANPTVNITLRNLSLKRILDFITDSVGFQYEVQADAVVLRPGGEHRNLNTEVFPVSRSTVIRMTGVTTSTSAPSVDDDPFAVAEAPTTSGGGLSGDGATIRNFLQQAGVDFMGVDGSTLAYDGSAMIVTQTTRNLERIRNILNRYTDVKQVEIEAKFLEVQEGLIEELGFDWVVSRQGQEEIYQSSLRSVAATQRSSSSGSSIVIGGEVIDQVAPPSLPGALPLGANASPFTNIVGTMGDTNIEVAIRALSQQEGSDLLSASKVTVLSGNEASLNVSQEFRYPTRYTDTESDVGNASGSINSGSAGVTITPGTPEDFETRNIGVELSVTPIVEEDDYSITLEMNPKVTEFEGFVEYGGPSIAISGNQVVKAPPGFFQPIFSVREVSTKVTIWDGATVVMGGLTREEMIRVDDKVPFFGDIPLLGRFFRSEGESSSKRNLLIFVTANLVSPGGSPKRQTLRGVRPGTMFQNPTIVTPGGSESRSQ